MLASVIVVMRTYSGTVSALDISRMPSIIHFRWFPRTQSHF